jgi:hypothetical protein
MKKEDVAGYTTVGVILLTGIFCLIMLRDDSIKRDKEKQLSLLLETKLEQIFTETELHFKERRWQQSLEILRKNELEFHKINNFHVGRIYEIKTSSEAELLVANSVQVIQSAILRKEWQLAISNLYDIENRKNFLSHDTMNYLVQLKSKVKEEIGDYELNSLNESSDAGTVAGFVPPPKGYFHTQPDQGGHYIGGDGSSHKGGMYSNPRTGGHYQKRK